MAKELYFIRYGKIIVPSGSKIKFRDFKLCDFGLSQDFILNAEKESSTKVVVDKMMDEILKVTKHEEKFIEENEDLIREQFVNFRKFQKKSKIPSKEYTTYEEYKTNFIETSKTLAKTWISEIEQFLRVAENGRFNVKHEVLEFE